MHTQICNILQVSKLLIARQNYDYKSLRSCLLAEQTQNSRKLYLSPGQSIFSANFTLRALNLMFGGAIKFGDSQMKYAILRNCSFVSDRRDNCPCYKKCSCLFQHPQAGEKFRKKAYPLYPLTFYQYRSPRISQMRRPKKFLFDLIYDPNGLTGLFKLSADKNGLIIRPLKKVQKQITDHPMCQPAPGR